MAKKIVRLTEGQLHNIITESVQRVLREMTDTEISDYYDGLEVFYNILEKYGFDVQGDEVYQTAQYFYNPGINPEDDEWHDIYTPVGIEKLYDAIIKPIKGESIDSIINYVQNLSDDEISSTLESLANDEVYEYVRWDRRFNKDSDDF